MTSRTRIKFCGITSPDDAKKAIRIGADAIGMVFFSKSKRAVSLAQAKAVREVIPPFVDVVALFVNPDEDYVREVIETVSPDLLQFHGTESPQSCERYGIAYLKAFHIGAPGLEFRDEVLTQCRRYPSARGWLFDSYSTGFGGSGQGFDLSLLGTVRNAPDARPMILAGGLTSESVAEKMRLLRPFAVDVSSGIEDAPGQKSEDKMRAFAEAVQKGDIV
jgi:Phosphoribosylanthranilate isomerase